MTAAAGYLLIVARRVVGLPLFSYLAVGITCAKHQAYYAHLVTGPTLGLGRFVHTAFF